jgi:hypothetical protein
MPFPPRLQRRLFLRPLGMLHQQPHHHRRIFQLNGNLKGKLDSLQRQVRFVGKVFGLGLFEIGVKGKSAQLSILGHLLIGHSFIGHWAFFVKVFGVVAQDVRERRMLPPIFAPFQQPLFHLPCLFQMLSEFLSQQGMGEGVSRQVSR